jgi:hypothetical protein
MMGGVVGLFVDLFVKLFVELFMGHRDEVKVEGRSIEP